MTSSQTIIVVPGDGIGPAITESVKQILKATDLKLDFQEHQMGKDATKDQIDAALQAFTKNGIMLKGPTETPVATKGQKSFNVTSRKGNGLFVNFRRSQSFHPLIQTHFPKQDIAIFRENEEGLYAAIEHQHSADVVQALSYKTLSGMHKIIRAAFEYAVKNHKSKVCCLHKGNILKKTEGNFLEIFQMIALDYPQIKANSQIIDDGMAKVATNPEAYEVIVTENLFGDILSDITTALTGSLGLGGSSNIGYRGAMFEAIHGTGPDIMPGAKFNSSPHHIANPSGLLHGGLLMLEYIGSKECLDASHLIKAAWSKVLESGFHTGDLSKLKDGTPNPMTKKIVNTHEFTLAIIETMEVMKKNPSQIHANHQSHLQYTKPTIAQLKLRQPFLTPAILMEVVGCDFFINWTGKEDLNVLLDLKNIIGFDLRDDFHLEQFTTMQQLYDWVLWLKKSLENIDENDLKKIFHELNVMNFIKPEVILIGKEKVLSRWHQFTEHHFDLVRLVTLSLAKRIKAFTGEGLTLEMISNRGQCVYPAIINPDLVDQFRCRFKLTNPTKDHVKELLKINQLQKALLENGFFIAKTEGLHEIINLVSGERSIGYGDSYGQGMGFKLNG
jgi:isocitrate dehydrogenase